MANKRGRRTYTREFKARVARDAMRDMDTVNAVAARHVVDPSLVRDWRRQAEANMKNAFGSAPKAEASQEALVKDLHAKIGELTMERDFFCRASGRPVTTSIRTRNQFKRPAVAACQRSSVDTN